MAQAGTSFSRDFKHLPERRNLVVPTAMPILFACQRIQKTPPGARRIIGVGAFFEVLYIPPEAPEAPAKAKAWPLLSQHPPSGDYAYICERMAPDGSFYYLNEGLTIPGPGERMFQGLHPGQCACCYYRKREILEWTTSGPGYLALMTPGWYRDHDGAWKWWHGDAPHGRPGWSCRNWQNHDIEASESLEAQPAEENLEAQPAEENLENLGNLIDGEAPAP